MCFPLGPFQFCLDGLRICLDKMRMKQPTSNFLGLVLCQAATVFGGFLFCLDWYCFRKTKNTMVLNLMNVTEVILLLTFNF